MVKDCVILLVWSYHSVIWSFSTYVDIFSKSGILIGVKEISKEKGTI